MTVAATADDALVRAAAVLAREAGVACPPTRERDLAQALRDRCRDNGFADVDAYVAQLEEEPSLIDDLVGALAVGETYFFRDPGQFEIIRGEILPSLIRAHGPALRVWSAGCASGEEAYSLAVLLAEAGVERSPLVLGTDISRAALLKAKEGTYGEWSFRGVPQSVRERYFERDGARYRIRSDIRARVRFDWLNLASDDYPSLRSGIAGVHLVICRNVLIYLTPDAVARVARHLYESLAPGGWLLTSPSDPPLADLAPFETLPTGAGLVYRRSADEATPSLDEPPVRSIQPPRVARPERANAGAAPARAPAPLEELRARLHDLVDRGEHREIERVLARAINAYPFDPELHYLVALVRREQGRDEEAAQAARRALYLDPGLTVATIALGSALRRQGDLRGARRAYRSAAAVLRGQSPDEPVQLSDGERAGGLLRSVESLLALVEPAP